MHKDADGAIISVVDSFLQTAVERGQLVPFDTAMYAKLLFGLVDSALFECFCVQGGRNEDEFRERSIEIVERLLFGPPLAVAQQEAPVQDREETF